VAIAFALKNEFGLVGLALAQVAQNLVMVFGGWFVVQYLVRDRLTFALPRRLRIAPLKDLAGFGMKLQLTAILGLASEPAIKYVLSIVGGLATVGMYELVVKGILLVRQLVIAPTPNLVPIFAASLASNRSRLAFAYNEVTARLAVLGGLAMATLAFGSPLISIVWLGHVQTNFVVFSVIMAAGWAVNIICIPGFSLGIAKGRLDWNILGNLITLLSGTLLGIALGSWFGDPVYVIAANAAAIGIGGLLSATMNCRRAGLRLLPDRVEYRSAVQSLYRLGRG
jgi:O-antigen/teichoic acid export membrane protein